MKKRKTPRNTSSPYINSFGFMTYLNSVCLLVKAFIIIIIFQAPCVEARHSSLFLAKRVRDRSLNVKGFIQKTSYQEKAP